MKKQDNIDALPPEWSHMVAAADIGTTPKRIRIAASEAERDALCHRLGVDSIDTLEADLTLTRDPRSLILHAEGRFRACFTQSCAVTLEPLRQEIEGAVEGWFADFSGAVSLTKVRREKQGKAAAATEVEILDEKDDPEALIDGYADLGELVVQHLSLSIDPYARKAGLPAPAEAGEGSATRAFANPFAALKDWKKR